MAAGRYRCDGVRIMLNYYPLRQTFAGNKAISSMKILSAFAIAILLLSSCTCPADNRLSTQEKQNGWTLLFDGNTLNGWHVYGKGNAPSNWKVDSGALFRNPKDTFGIADLTSDKSYENYEFTFDWKIAREGNSGVFINVQEDTSMHHAWESGPEYQLLDSSHIDYKIPVKRAGCLYGFYPQKTAVKALPAGDWNHSRIVQNKGKVQFYLNDVLTEDVDFTTVAWQDTIAKTRFKDFPQFGKNTKGYIALQDWGSPVYFKNLKLKVL